VCVCVCGVTAEGSVLACVRIAFGVEIHRTVCIYVLWEVSLPLQGMNALGCFSGVYCMCLFVCFILPLCVLYIANACVYECKSRRLKN
jgi:hypothetical protein